MTQFAGMRSVGIGFVGSTLVGACTVFAGWSDLQGGTRPRADASGDDSSFAETGADVPSIDGGAPCGAITCQPQEGCCVADVSAGYCSDRAGCPIDNLWLRCTERRQCVLRGGSARVCCLDPSTAEATCTDTCDSSNAVLCDPKDVGACATAATCQGLNGTNPSQLHQCR